MVMYLNFTFAQSYTPFIISVLFCLSSLIMAYRGRKLKEELYRVTYLLLLLQVVRISTTYSTLIVVPLKFPVSLILNSWAVHVLTDTCQRSYRVYCETAKSVQSRLLEGNRTFNAQCMFSVNVAICKVNEELRTQTFVLVRNA